MKIALLTVFDENYRELADRTLPSMRRYADRFGLELICASPETDGRLPPWGKIRRIRDVLQSGFDYCFFVDVDAIFVRFDADIRDHITAGKDLYICWHGPEISEPFEPVEGHFNTGVMLWRNCAWSIDLLDEVWRQTDFVDHRWMEQAALLNLLGFRRALELGDDDPATDLMSHIEHLPVDWNVIGCVVAPDPIIRHFAGKSKAARLRGIDDDQAVQPLRELLPASRRHLLTRQLNAMWHRHVTAEQRFQQVDGQRQDTERDLRQLEQRTELQLHELDRRLQQAEQLADGWHQQADQALAERDGLLRSRSRLIRALWRAVRGKVGSHRA